MTTAIVVDTNVARASGQGHLSAGSPAPQCIRCLDAIRERSAKHKDFGVAMSRALRAEWDEHAGSYAIMWLGQMIARRRCSFENRPWPEEKALEEASQSLPGKGHKEVLKDVPVVGLAMLTGRRVLSLDDRQRELLARLTASVESLRTLHWVNPTHADAEKWLRTGAPRRKAYCIAP